jgi:hypothetical protein
MNSNALHVQSKSLKKKTQINLISRATHIKYLVPNKRKTRFLHDGDWNQHSDPSCCYRWLVQACLTQKQRGCSLFNYCRETCKCLTRGLAPPGQPRVSCRRIDKWSIRISQLINPSLIRVSKPTVNSLS